MMGMLGSKELLVLFLAAMICGCAARHDVQPSFASSDSGIHGRLVATRTDGGAVEAAQGRVNVVTADETQEVASVDTDSSGNFEIGLRPGKYFVYIEPIDGMLYGRKVAVAPRQMTELELCLPPQ